MGIVDAAVSLVGLFSDVSGIVTGSRLLKKLDLVADRVERLSEKILYAPSAQVVRHVSKESTQNADLRKIRRLLEPVQRTLNSTIVSSNMIPAPRKMKEAFRSNPWSVLDQVRPVSVATPHSNPDMIPVLFAHKGEQFVGWQMRGALPAMFDCRYENIWSPPTNFGNRENSLGNQTYSASMDSGPRLGHADGLYYGACHAMEFATRDRGKSLRITVDTSNRPVCWIEIWRGSYDGRDALKWARSRRFAARSKKGVYSNPSLVWKVEPGAYVAYFVNLSRNNVVSREVIRYAVEMA